MPKGLSKSSCIESGELEFWDAYGRKPARVAEWAPPEKEKSADPDTYKQNYTPSSPRKPSTASTYHLPDSPNLNRQNINAGQLQINDLYEKFRHPKATIIPRNLSEPPLLNRNSTVRLITRIIPSYVR